MANHGDRGGGLRRLGALVCAAVVVAGTACGHEARPPNLVLITVDTLRADHVGAYGYFRETTPAIDRLAGEGMVFEHVIAPMATTLPSHASLMTSTYPVRHGVLSNLQFFEQPVVTTDETQTVAQLLRRAGYATAAFTSSSPLSEASGISAGFDTFVGPPPYATERARIDIPAGETTGHALGWLDGAPAPFFLWVHLFDPHHPYEPPAPYDRAFASGAELREVLEQRHVPPQFLEDAAEVVNLYDGEILYADTQIGRILAALERRGDHDDSVVVVTSDHGEGLYQHKVVQHGWIWNEQLFVPLIIRFPGGRSGRVSSLTSLIDVLPTIAEEAGLPLETRRFDGINVLKRERTTALAQREIRAPVWLKGNWALLSPGWKYMYYEDAQDILFDLRKDPYETTNVYGVHPEVARGMKDETLRLIEENRAKSPLRRLESMPGEVLEQMRSLGYVE